MDLPGIILRMRTHLFRLILCFFFNDTATPEIYTLSLHDALPIWPAPISPAQPWFPRRSRGGSRSDRKSTRLNSSHEWKSYAVLCLKKKKKKGYCIRSIITKESRNRRERKREFS